MKTIVLLTVLLLAGCAGGQLVVTEKSGNRETKLLEWQDDAGQWHSVDATSALYDGWYGGN
jgi:hypothetical protein